MIPDTIQEGLTFDDVLLQPARSGVLPNQADTRTLVTRNVLRVIDIGIFFIPLLLIPLFPLRQRVGDIAAGTLVVYGQVPVPGEKNEQPEAVQSASDRDE